MPQTGDAKHRCWEISVGGGAVAELAEVIETPTVHRARGEECAGGEKSHTDTGNVLKNSNSPFSTDFDGKCRGGVTQCAELAIIVETPAIHLAGVKKCTGGREAGADLRRVRQEFSSGQV